MSKDVFFQLGIALIVMHEMDAVRCKEWRIFPGLSALSDQWGFVLFMFAHIPLYFLVLINFQSGSETFRFGFDVFLIVHVVLHILFLRHQNNLFRDWISWGIIGGAGFFGLLDIIIK